ncbi:MAG: hypothetical protein DRJ69_05820 [Thermoprotei archaeon]|nr:MAG: hypothetical protein DRJ69_05820 [Thermoprotei archaeon]
MSQVVRMDAITEEVIEVLVEDKDFRHLINEVVETVIERFMLNFPEISNLWNKLYRESFKDIYRAGMRTLEELEREREDNPWMRMLRYASEYKKHLKEIRNKPRPEVAELRKRLEERRRWLIENYRDVIVRDVVDRVKDMIREVIYEDDRV